MKPTPETDALVAALTARTTDKDYHWLCCKLERERDEARIARDLTTKVAMDACAERDGWRTMADELVKALEETVIPSGPSMFRLAEEHRQIVMRYKQAILTERDSLKELPI